MIGVADQWEEQTLKIKLICYLNFAFGTLRDYAELNNHIIPKKGKWQIVRPVLIQIYFRMDAP